MSERQVFVPSEKQTSVYHMAVSILENALPSAAIPVLGYISDGLRYHCQYGGFRMCASVGCEVSKRDHTRALVAGLPDVCAL